ncbi:MAG: medium chain dehydrogenase/reductase family protein, partial [Deltaproteobacteria bacterium]|nr:medium chain dehydrogenase/reductase family protein [Deltaproteobacteria bacterium]
RSAADPEAGPGQVRVRVSAAGINFADIMARMGLYPDAPPLPCVVGYEVAGTIDQVGAGVLELSEGDRVMAMTRFDGYSDTVVIPAEQAIAIPDGLSDEDAAAVPVQYLTAYLMLIRLGNLQPGERVLIHSAGGGVGLAATQLARWRGAEIFGTASAGKHERLREVGVTHCIDYRNQDFQREVERITGGRGVHLVIDAVGGKSFKKSYQSLAKLGRLFCFGISTMAPGEKRSLLAAAKGFVEMPRWGALGLMQDNRGVFGCNLGDLWDEVEIMTGMLRSIAGLIEGGVLSPTVDATFPFSRAGQAHHYIQDRKNFGKVLLIPD